MIFMTLILSLSKTTVPSGWPMLRANEQRTGYVQGYSHFSDSAIKKWDLLIQNSEGDVIYSSPVSADFNGDTKNDILVGSCSPSFPTADLYRGYDGTFIWATPDTEMGPYFCTPALMDINGDGKPEVFESTCDSLMTPSVKGYFKAYDGNNGALLWEKRIVYGDSLSAFSLYTKDCCAPLVIEGDSGTVITGDEAGVLWAFNATNGNVRWVDTLPINLQPPSRGDVDGDGNKEIVVVGGASLYVLNDAGNIKWSTAIGDTATTPALSNFDADTALEIVVYCYGTGKIKVFNSGNSTPFIDVTVGIFAPDYFPESSGHDYWQPSPGVVDMTGDGIPDIIIHNGKNLYCVNGATGTLEWNKAYANLFGSPVLANLNSDSCNEIIVTGYPPDTSHRSQVNYFENNGDRKWTWNSESNGYRDPILNEACLTDVDGDGDLEIAIVDYSCYCALLDVPGGAVEENKLVKTDYNLSLSQNPFSKSTIISYSVGNSRDCSLRIYDLTGRCVKTIVNEQKPAGSYTTTLTATELKTGIYFVRLNAGNFSTTKKLILMK
ncbi:MAG: FG-GAP-like repeat-containing protein [bacterium]|nr:FG-GAP-like repeat-containing protein [bacterium]